MFHPRASARGRAAALLAVFCAAGCATTHPTASSYNRGPVTASMVLSPAEQRQADALAEYATGVSAELQGDFDEALEHYQRVLQIDPQHTAIIPHMVQIYSANRDITNAVAVLETGIKANPDDPALLYWLGYIYRSDNQDEKAAAAFRQSLKLDPANLSAVGGLLEIDMTKDAPAESIEVLDRAFRQKAAASAYWARLGDFYAEVARQKPAWAQKIDHKRIQQCYEKAVALGADDTDLELRLADTYADNGAFQKAADEYSRLLAKNPDGQLDRVIREREAANYIRADQKEKAAAALEEVIKREPLAYTVYNYLGELYAEMGKTEKAISNYQQSLAVKPKQPDNYWQITALQLDAKQIDQALETLGAWKSSFPTDFRVPYFIGLIQTDRKQYTNAVTSFADAESLAQESPDQGKLTSKFYFSYGAACERAGDSEKAIKLFRKCLKLDPDDHTACNYLGYMLADKGVDLDEALTLIQHAVKLDPNNGAYLDSLGWVLFKLGRNDEALVQLRRATQFLKDDAIVFSHLADVLVKVGKTEEALTVLRHASEMEPGNKEISDKLQKLKDNQSAAH